MKKLLVVSLTLILLATLSLTAFAVDNNFVSSRSLEQAPALITITPIGINTNNVNTNNTLKVVPYVSRETLPTQLKDNIENAYNVISSNQDITTLNSELSNIAKNNNIDSSNLAISNLFNAHKEDNNGAVISQQNDKYTVALSGKTADNFVALMRLNSGGTWEIVKDAKLTNNKLTFTATDSASYAVVVNNTGNIVSDINESTVSIVEDNSSANGSLKIVSYNDRNNLPEALKTGMEKAFNEIKDNEDLTELVPEIKDIVKKNKYNSEDISVSSLFDIHSEDSDGNVIDGDKYSITIASDAAKNFVGLMRRNSNGKWELVEDAKLSGDKLSFTFNGSAPYAILVNNTVSTTSPVTGDNSLNLAVVFTVIFALAFTGVILNSKKQNG